MPFMVNKTYKDMTRDEQLAYHREKNRAYYLKRVGKLSRQSPLTSDPEITKEKKRISVSVWQQNNPEKVAQSRSKQKLNGNDRIRAARRRATKKNATPAWADLEAIKDVYLEAQYMQMDVDHIYPLTSDHVCGLHVWENLQLLPKKINIKKSNNFPSEEYVSCLI